MIYPGGVHPALTLALYALAVARATVLVTEDRITERPREWALNRLYAREQATYLAEIRREVEESPAGVWTDQMQESFISIFRRDNAEPHGYLAYLLTCQWCASIWLALPAVVVWWNWPTQPWSLGPAILLAFSMITGKLSQIGG